MVDRAVDAVAGDQGADPLTPGQRTRPVAQRRLFDDPPNELPRDRLLREFLPHALLRAE